MSKNIDADAASSKVEKGNPKETPTFTISESSKKLGLEESKVTMDNPEDMSMDDLIPDNENVVDDLFQTSIEKSCDQKDVGPDDETSLDQQDEQSKEAKTLDKEELDRKTSSDKEDTSKVVVVDSSSEEEEQVEKEHTEEEYVHEEDVHAGKDDDDRISKEGEPSHETDSDKEVSSDHYIEKPPPEK